MYRKISKKGLSVVISYVILISVAITMSIFVYNWLKTYVPKEALECPEDTSIFIKSYTYTCNERLNLTIKNNGKFSIDGYYIHVSNRTEEISTIDLSSKILSGGKLEGSEITFSDINKNSLSPEEPNVRTSSFNTTGYGNLTKVEIIPIRKQTYEGKTRIVSCGDAMIAEDLTCT